MAHESKLKFFSIKQLNLYLSLIPMGLNSKTLSVIATLLLSLAAWYSTSPETSTHLTQRHLGAYQTTQTRIDSLNSACPGYSRSSLAAPSSRSSYLDGVNSTLGINGVLILRYVFNNRGNDAQTEIRNNQTGLILFILQFLIGLALFIVTCPFLMCCCICPRSCPCCCRKPEDDSFSNLDIKGPMVFVLIMLAGVIVCSAYVLIAIGNNDSAQKAACAMAVTYDDALNGNISSSGNYFIGINSIPTMLSQINGNLSSINSNLTELSSSSSSTVLNQAITQATTTSNDVIKISNNDAAGNDLTLNYNTPFDATSTTGTVASTFPSVLGSFKSQKGYVWAVYSAVNVLSTLLSTLKSNATTFSNSISDLTNALSSATTQSTTLKSSISSNSRTANDNLKNGSNSISAFRTVNQILPIAAIVLAVFSIVIVLCLCNAKRDGCRCLLYLLCFLLFLLTLLAFFVAVFLSIMVPVATWGCNFFQDSFSSQLSFQSNFYSISTANLNYVGACLPYGDGDILSRINTNASSNLAILNGILNTTTTFNSSAYTASIKTPMDAALSGINQYALSQIIDINDTPSINKLLALQSCSGQSNCNGNCQADSWLPSNSLINNTNAFTCSASNGNKGNSSTCSNGVSSASGGCSGCMDTSQVLYYYLNPARNLPADLISRYGAICSFNAVLNNVWTNYYKIKETALGPTVGSTVSASGVYPRANTANSDFATLTTKINSLNTTFTNINSGLNNLMTLVDPTYGLFASLNCKVIGEDAQTAMNLWCGPAYDYLYLLRLGVGIMSYFLAVSVCCLVCVGNRNYRREEGENYINNEKQGNGFESGQNLAYMQPQPQPQPGSGHYGQTIGHAIGNGFQSAK